MTRTRVEHLEWAKQRALEYVIEGELALALSSFGSDMNKHDDLKISSADYTRGVEAVTSGRPALVKQWINGFK